MQTLKLFVASGITLFLLLNIWTKSYHYGCLSLIVPIIILLLISSSFIALKMHERICLKKCYFASHSLFAKMLSSRFLVILFYLLTSVLMTLSALYIMIDFDKALWIYLFFHIMIATLLYTYLTQRFQNIVKTSYRALFAREWTINITAIFFILAYLDFAINGYEPTYMQNSLQATYEAASNSFSCDCAITNYFLKLQREIESIFWWFIDKETTHIQNRTLAIFIWLAFLLINSFALLGINRLIVQVIYLLDKLFQAKKV